MIPWEVSSPGFIPRKNRLRSYPKKERVDHGKGTIFEYSVRLLILAFSLISCGGGGGGGSSDGGGNGGGTTERDWTYMVYMGADNNLSSAGEGDIAEMATVGSTSAVAVVVQAEFSQQFSGTGVPADTRRMLIQKGRTISPPARASGM
jgi:hypothetical protein